MKQSTRAQLVLDTFTVVADLLVNDFDAVELLHDLVERCAAIFDAVDVSLVVADTHGELVVTATTSTRARHTEILKLSAANGPCVDAYESGYVVTSGSPENMVLRWPAFAEIALDSGYQSAHAVPLRWRKNSIGSLNFFSDREAEFEVDEVLLAHTIADFATIALVQARAHQDPSPDHGRLQRPLNERVVIEQAKGFIAHSRHVDIEHAWTLLRHRARSDHARVFDTAQGVVRGLITI